MEGGEKWARYSFLGSDPLMVFTARGNRVTLRHADGRTEQLATENRWKGSRSVLARFTPVPVPGLPRFQGGAVGFFSYDIVRHVERLPRLRQGRSPAARRGVHAHRQPPRLRQPPPPAPRHRQRPRGARRIPARLDRAYDAAAVKIGMLLAKLARPARPPAPLTFPDPQPLVALGEEGFTSTMDQATFMEAVHRTKEYIAAGDAYQVVISRRLDAELKADPFTVYRALRTINPSPYLFFLRLGKTSIVGSSPEVLVRLEEGRVEERPIAGTHPRGATEAQDARAGRADGSRIPRSAPSTSCWWTSAGTTWGGSRGSGRVEVTEFMVVERYSHVMHLVSHVRGQLAPGKDAFDVLAACFPAGTLSGAPKVRAMEIIEELEPTRRGPYGGAVGYISYSGNMDSCITIRTVVCHGQRASIQVGAGIVADSDPKTEWLETCSKSRGMILALRTAAQETGR